MPIGESESAMALNMSCSGGGGGGARAGDCGRGGSGSGLFATGVSSSCGKLSAGGDMLVEMVNGCVHALLLLQRLFAGLSRMIPRTRVGGAKGSRTTSLEALRGMKEETATVGMEVSVVV